MRQVLSVSLPGETIDEIKNRVKKRGFTSISSYIKALIKEDEGYISEKELLETVQEARQDYDAGKLKTLKSMKDLM